MCFNEIEFPLTKFDVIDLNFCLFQFYYNQFNSV